MTQTFSALGINEELSKALAALEISVPTAIQQQAIPVLLNDKSDVVATAKTGTGKTFAFCLPLLQLIDHKTPVVQSVILVPTRELGKQVFDNIEMVSRYLPGISIASVCGGNPVKPQIQRLQQTTHIVVATPGRLIDMIQRKAIDISKTKYLILDEADQMVTDLKEGLDIISAELPKNRKTWLFSATMPGAIKQLVQNYMSKNAVLINCDMEISGNPAIDHQYIVVDPIEKLNVLMHFLNTNQGKQGIIFCKTKAAVNKLAKNLAINRFSSGALHGSLTQPIRDRIMGQFRDGHINILVATDLAARGIDITGLSFVVNYHLPDTYELYVHRSGRTARAGAKGLSLTVLQPEEAAALEDFQKELGITFTPYEKPSAQSIEDNNMILWARQIFKTKPDHSVSKEIKDLLKSVFHHLTKEELIEKLIANYALQHKKENDDKPKRK